MKTLKYTLAVLATGFALATSALAQSVNITPDTPKVEFRFSGKTYVIERNQNPDHRIPDDFAKTSRACPPFCVQPISPYPGVNPVAELELFEFLENKVSNGEGFLIDSRTPDWYVKGTIPSAVNLPFSVFVPGPDNLFFDSIMQMLGGKQDATGEWAFKDPKDLLLFCNGPWCEQSPTAIRNLIAINYPPEKLHYYRGGMQDWLALGFNTEIPN